MQDLSVPSDEVLRRLKRDNPWWANAYGDDSAAHAAWPKRSYFDAFAQLANARDVRRAVVLIGPRRVGKTVMLKQWVYERLASGVPGNCILYASLDTPTYSRFSLEGLLRFFVDAHQHSPRTPLWVVFDGIQYLHDWQVHLKSLVDAYPHVRFVASGSAAAALRRQSQESGAGRFTEFMLPPLGFAEYLRFSQAEDLLIEQHDAHDPLLACTSADITALNQAFVQYLNVGGYPEAAVNPSVRADPERFIGRDIVEKVLLKDLPSLYGIANTQELNRFFNTLAYHTGKELGLEDLGKEAELSRHRLLEYLEYLEAAFLIRRAHRIDENALRMKRERTFKVFLTNTAMRCALFGPVSIDEPVMGHLVETAVWNQYLHDTRTSRFMHYARWKRGRSDLEVDLVKLTPNTQKPAQIIEVKWSDTAARNQNRELEAGLALAKQHGLQALWVTTRTLRQRATLDGVELCFMPTALFCCAVERALQRSSL